MSDDRRYKTYLTKRGKYEAHRICNRGGSVTIEALLFQMRQIGEAQEFLTEKWAKRVLSDESLFEPRDDDSWVMLERTDLRDAPKWKGARPGEDVCGDALADAVASIRPDNRPPLWKPANEAWREFSKVMVRLLDRMKDKGVEKPLAELQERAFLESLTAGGDSDVQVVALWLLRARMSADDFGRMRKGETRDIDLLFYSADDHEAALKNARRRLQWFGLIKRSAA